MKKVYLIIILICIPICIFSQNTGKVLDSLDLSKESEKNWESYKQALQISPLNNNFDGSVEGSYLKNNKELPFKGSIKSRDGLLKVKISNEDGQRKTKITVKTALIEAIRVFTYISNMSNSKQVSFKEYVTRKSNNQWCFYDISKVSKESLKINKEKKVGRCVSLDDNGSLYKIEYFISSKTPDDKDKALVRNHRITIEFESNNNSLSFSRINAIFTDTRSNNQMKFIINFSPIK